MSCSSRSSHIIRFGDGKQAQLFRSPHRYIWPAELDLMGQLAGFELESRHADWAGAESLPSLARTCRSTACLLAPERLRMWR